MDQLGPFIQSHWVLWLALTVVLALIFIHETRALKEKAKALSPQWAVDLMNQKDAIVVDIRDKEQYAKGHILDAIHLKKDEVNEEKLKKYKKKPIIITCERGLNAPEIALKLKSHGFEDVHPLQGGIDNWRAAGLPLVKNKK